MPRTRRTCRAEIAAPTLAVYREPKRKELFSVSCAVGTAAAVAGQIRNPLPSRIFTVRIFTFQPCAVCPEHIKSHSCSESPLKAPQSLEQPPSPVSFGLPQPAALEKI
eukprot:gene11207-2034_t